MTISFHLLLAPWLNRDNWVYNFLADFNFSLGTAIQFQPTLIKQKSSKNYKPKDYSNPASKSQLNDTL